MAWNPNIPTVTNRVQDDLDAIRENFQHLDPLAQAVDELQTVSGLAPITDDLQAVSGLAPYVQAILDSRIVEMGSNSNGTYVRWENGLQVCFTRLTTSSSQDTLWTLPAAFINSEWVFSGGVGDAFNSGIRVITFEGRTTNSISLRILNASGGRVQSTAFIIAIGRWK